MTRTASLAGIAVLAFAAPLAAQRGERLFYYVDREDSYNSLVQHIGSIDVLAPSAYNVDENGVVYGTVDPRVLALARERGVTVMPCS